MDTLMSCQKMILYPAVIRAQLILILELIMPEGQFRGDGRTVRTLVFGVYKI